MNRRKLVRIVCGIIVVAFIALAVVLGMKAFTKLRGEQIPLNVVENSLTVGGISREYKIFLLADSHISLVDEGIRTCR